MQHLSQIILIHLRHSVFLCFSTCHTFMRKYSSSRTWSHIKYVHITAALISEGHSATRNHVQHIYTCTHICVFSIFNSQSKQQKQAKKRHDVMRMISVSKYTKWPAFPYIDDIFLFFFVKNGKRCMYSVSFSLYTLHAFKKLTTKPNMYRCMYMYTICTHTNIKPIA